MWMWLLACTAPEPVELLDVGAWEAVDPGHPLAGAPCSDAAFRAEDTVIEVSTEGCEPVAIVQALHTPIEPGDALEIVWWHDFLFFEEPVEGRFALFIDGELLYDKTVPIPSSPAAYTEAFEAASGGSELVLRVENHGNNTWNLLRLTRAPIK